MPPQQNALNVDHDSGQRQWCKIPRRRFCVPAHLIEELVDMAYEMGRGDAVVRLRYRAIMQGSHWSCRVYGIESG